MKVKVSITKKNKKIKVRHPISFSSIHTLTYSYKIKLASITQQLRPSISTRTVETHNC